MTAPRLRLALAALAFVGWLAWLGYTSLTKSRAPAVSRAQFLAAATVVVAEVRDGEGGKPAPRVKVEEPLAPNAPAAGAEIDVVNLTEAGGYVGPGKYLLLLAPHGDRFRVAGQPRSPGFEGGVMVRPPVYPWSEDVRAQYQRLRP